MSATPDLVILPLGQLVYAAQNPRSDAGEAIAGLAASMASEHEPYLIQPPTVECITSSSYRIVSGERRVRGAALAGWATLACLVHKPLDPLLSHTIRVVENLHRVDLHPLDSATALKIAWLASNGLALDAGPAVRSTLAAETSPSETLAALTAIVTEAGFVPTRPPVTWEVLLGRLGLAIDRERLKKLLRVLNLTPVVLQAMRPLGLSEAALRALGTLTGADQELLAQALSDDPTLGRQIRRIARRVRQQGYSIEQALAEAQGRVYAAERAASIDDGVAGEGESPAVGTDCADAVLRLLEAADQLGRAIAALQAATGHVPISAIPAPWGEVAAEALTLARAVIPDT